MPDYQYGKIYKIVCNSTGLVYIGSTCEKYLSQRIDNHRRSFRKYIETGRGNFISSFEILKNDNYDIVLLEKYPCSSVDELHKKEREYIENTNCVNLCNPIRLNGDKKAYDESWREQNKVHVVEYKKNYRLENKESIQQYTKLYYEKKKEENPNRNAERYMKYQERCLSYAKKYRDENKDKVNDANKKQYEKNKEYNRAYSREYQRIKRLYLQQLKYYNI